MTSSDMKKVFARGRKSAPHLFISPSHVLSVQSLPLVVVNGITLCVFIAQKWAYTVTFFPCGCTEQINCFHTYIIILKDESPDNIVCFYFISTSPSTGAGIDHVFRSDAQMSESSYFQHWIQSLLFSYVWQRITDNVFAKFPFPRDSEGTFAHLALPHVPLRATVSLGSVGVLCFLSELL